MDTRAWVIHLDRCLFQSMAQKRMVISHSLLRIYEFVDVRIDHYCILILIELLINRAHVS